MLKHTNDLKGLPATQAYVDFGLEQANSANKRFSSWLAEQRFEDKSISSEYGQLTVSGTSEGRDYKSKECQDNIKWELRFKDEEKNKGLSDALLHEKRYPEIKTLNSKPQLFSTADYMQILVKNGERGWVKKGEFPVNVRADFDYDARQDDPHQQLPIIGVQTDVKREALAGFEAAYHWQCFRALAVASAGFISTQLANESKDKTDRDFYDLMRSRWEMSYPLFVQLLPDTRLKNEAAALKPFYNPGTLEGALALELEHFIQVKYGEREKAGVRPIYLIKGHPIEITSTSRYSYDAVAKLYVQTYCRAKDDEIKQEIQKHLGKHFNIEMKTGSDMEVTLELEDAQRIEQDIQNGGTNTALHKFARNFGEALRYTYEALSQWHDKTVPALEKDYKKTVDDKRTTHFSGLEEKFAGLVL